MSSRVIGLEDWEGNNGNSVVTEDDDNDDADAEAGEYVCDFLDVGLQQLCEGHFGRTAPMTMMMQTSREDEHDEDAMVHSRKTRLARGVVILAAV